MNGRVLSFALCGALGCVPTADTPTTTAPAATGASAPATVQDLVWGGVDYDVRHLEKERFLDVVRKCWSLASERAKGSAGVARVDLRIDKGGKVVDGGVSILLFHDQFMGAQDSAGETAFRECAEPRLVALKVEPATADVGSLSFDVRLLPARAAN